jgi:hypothetical protein
MTAPPRSPDELDERFVPRLRDGVVAVPVAEEAVLYEEDTGDLHRLDEVATIVVGRFDGSTSVGRAVDELVAAFGAPREVVGVDVLALVRELGQKGLLDGVQRTVQADEAVDAADEGC